MTITTKNHTVADTIAELRAGFDKRHAAIEAALAAQPDGFVFCWPKYGLGVKVTGQTTFAVVGVENAEIVNSNDPRKFCNGAYEYAILLPRKDAMETALRNSRASQATLESSLQKSEG